MTETKRKAVFIDRDGTLIEEVNFLSRVEDLRLFSFTADAVRLLKDGYAWEYSTGEWEVKLFLL